MTRRAHHVVILRAAADAALMAALSRRLGRRAKVRDLRELCAHAIEDAIVSLIEEESL